MAKVTFKGIWHVLKSSFSSFSDHKVPKLAASLAYYTVFSLGPLLLVIISLASIFLGREAIEGSIYSQMRGFVGSEAAAQIQEIVKNGAVDGKGGVAATIGIITLLIGATTMFAELQDSINTIWGLKPKPKQGLWLMIKTRLLSFGVIGALGFLLLVSLAVTAIISGLSDRLQAMFPGIGVAVMTIINMALSLGITTLLFAVIFRVLPDARIPWRDVWAGAFATSILFLVGKFAISLYIGKSDIGSSFGTAGSMIVLLVWIYYSSIILYFGAEFTRAYVIEFGDEITPNKYAVIAKTVVVEGEHSSLQELENDKKGIATPEKKEPQSEAPKKKTPLPAKKAAPATLVYEPVQPEKTQKGKQPAEDGLYRIRIEKKKETGIGMALAGLVLFFVNTALDQSREMRR